MSLARGDEVRPDLKRKRRPHPAELWTTCAKRLLQQYPSDCGHARPSATGPKGAKSRRPRGYLDNVVSYLGVDGMAEEWWSTICQRSPFLT
jgi:hypothetical protein